MKRAVSAKRRVVEVGAQATGLEKQKLILGLRTQVHHRPRGPKDPPWYHHLQNQHDSFGKQGQALPVA